MALFDDASSLLPGLRPASFRGVPFWVVDVRQAVGRRIHTTFFPGTDIKTHDDMGMLDGPFRLSGLVIGEDYVAQAQALRSAFLAPGPASFVHPWLGPRLVVVLRPAEISFASDELQVARFDVELDPTQGVAGGVLAGLSLGLLRASLGRLADIAQVLGIGGMLAGPVSAIAWGLGTAAALRSVLLTATALGRSREASRAAPMLAAANAQMAVAIALPPGESSAAAIITAIRVLARDSGVIWRTLPQPATSPAADAPIQPVPDARIGTSLLIGLADLVGAEPVRLDQDRAVLLSAEALMLGEGLRTLTDIAFDSRQEAMAWRDRGDDALLALRRRLALVAPQRPALVAPLMAQIDITRSALARDLGIIIGRLPEVQLLTLQATVPAVLIAQQIAGDNPALLMPMVNDIARRNGLRHPGAVSGTVEVLA